MGPVEFYTLLFGMFAGIYALYYGLIKMVILPFWDSNSAPFLSPIPLGKWPSTKNNSSLSFFRSL